MGAHRIACPPAPRFMPWVISLIAVCMGSAFVAASSEAAVTADTATPQLTIVFSRTALSAADQSVGGERGTCVRDDRDIAPLDTVVAPYISTRYPSIRPLVGSIETGHTPDTAYWCSHNGMTAAASWADMKNLQAVYGWRFISASATRGENWPKLTPDQINAETCGSRDDIFSHGLLGAYGQYNWPDNQIVLSIQQQYIQQCFYFGRKYGPGITTLSWSLVNDGLQLTRGIHGGHCIDSTQPCHTGIAAAYLTPSRIIRLIKGLQAGQWLSLQSYVFVTGTNPTYSTNKARWDCTSPDPARHWTNDQERYCWVDFQAILAAIPPTVQVNAPDGVAAVWGMAPPVR